MWILVPIKQNKRKFNKERVIALADEVEKLLKVKFIREVAYPYWLSNEENKRKVKKCINYIDKNKACLKTVSLCPTSR